jgi:hypothetical protein
MDGWCCAADAAWGDSRMPNEAGIQPRRTGAPLVLEPWICRSLPARLGLVGSGRTAPPWASTRSGGNAGSSCAGAGAARGSWTRVARVR